MYSYNPLVVIDIQMKHVIIIYFKFIQMMSWNQKVNHDINNNICDAITFEIKPMYISVASIDFEKDVVTSSIIITQNMICILS